MEFDTINQIPASNAWVFFAFSIDYESGKVVSYIKSYDGLTEPILSKSDISFPEYTLNKNAIMIVADVPTNNKIYSAVGGFKG